MADLPVLDDRHPMGEVVAGLTTKAEKIRALHRASYSRSEIAQYLGIRYQHVWNVINQSESGEGPLRAGEVPSRVWAKVGEGGRVVIPAAYRRAMGVAEGDHVQLRFQDGEVRVLSRSRVIRQVQERVAQHIEPGRSLVDELIAERRREAAREDAGG